MNCPICKLPPASIDDFVNAPNEKEDGTKCWRRWNEISECHEMEDRVRGAAFELLDALEKAFELMESQTEFIEREREAGRSIQEIEKDGDLPSEIIAARAAIAKAKGL